MTGWFCGLFLRFPLNPREEKFEAEPAMPILVTVFRIVVAVAEFRWDADDKTIDETVVVEAVDLPDDDDVDMFICTMSFNKFKK